MGNAIQESRGHIKDVSLEQALSERYLSYSLSTITARSLPDVRDGLKPVQRRILYAMNESGNTAGKSYRKSASAVGYVMMKYHPHGNDPIYEAMVRLAQDFSTRYPMIDGQGNFGSIDGDNAAAMRYTEARMTQAAEAMLEGINEEAVDFQDTYNAETTEPLVLPAAFPNLLANGATGIAVGMATNIPPHNVGEICEALLYLIRHPQASVELLMKHLPGPDFPTGGVMIESPASLLKIYETGRGSIRLRARWQTEELKGGTYQIVVTELPYQVQKSKLVERLATLIQEKKIPILSDVRDESTTDIRLILVPKSRNVVAEVLMETLFRSSDLEVRFNLNMNVLDQGRIPKVMNLREVLQAFLAHRRVVLCRRTRYRLNRIDQRLEILEGYRIAYLNLDEVIRIIREEDAPGEEMIKRWHLTEIQVEAILNMRLRALRKLEEFQILEEIKTLTAEKEVLKDLLMDETKQWQRIADEIRLIRKNFGPGHAFGKRRTSFADPPELGDVPLEAMIEREPATIICSRKDWIRSLKGHALQMDGLKYKEGDEGRFILQGETTDKLVIFASNGRSYTIPVDRLPGGRSHGESLRLMIDLPNDEYVVTMFVVNPSLLAQQLLIASSDGRGFLTSLQDVLAQTRAGKQILNVTAPVTLKKAELLTGDSVACVGENRKMLVFPVGDIPVLNRGRGVLFQKYRDGGLADLKIFQLSEGLSWISGSRKRTENDLSPWLGKRAQAGRMVPAGFPRSGTFEG